MNNNQAGAWILSLVLIVGLVGIFSLTSDLGGGDLSGQAVKVTKAKKAAKCGDLVCNPWETMTTCPSDCGPSHIDSDGDRLNDIAETGLGLDPNNPDTDGDGENDFRDWNQGWDPLDCDNPHYSGDDDGDGISNCKDATPQGDPDTDGDGLTDFDEINTYGTDPYIADDDGDGYNDGEEVLAGTDPRDANDWPGPDLVISDIHNFTVHNWTWWLGAENPANASLNVTIQNVGTEPTPPNEEIRVRATITYTLSDGSTETGEHWVYYYYPLHPGYSLDIGTAYSYAYFPSELLDEIKAGNNVDVEVTAEVDYTVYSVGGRIAETNEGNNALTETITVTPDDLDTAWIE